MPIAKSAVNIGLSSTILVIFFIAIAVGYSYVEEARQNQVQLKQTQMDMNKSLNQILDRQAVRVTTDNIRFNATLSSLGQTYQEIQTLVRQAEYQNQITTDSHNKISGTIENNTRNNLNLTKFNRASLMDTNDIVHEIKNYLIHNQSFTRPDQ